MNVAIFASAFYPHVGGVEELCRQLALELRRVGHGVIVLTNRWPRDLPRREEIDGIPVYRPAFRTPDAGLKSEVTYRLTRVAVGREVLGILRQHRIDVLHVQCVSANAHYALEARRALGLPLVVTLQGELTMDASQLFQRSAFARRTLRRCFDEAEFITACSAKTLADAEAFVGRRAERGRVIFNGASVGDFAGAAPFQHERPYVLAIGRVVPQKGIDVLLRAFAAARETMTTHDLLIAGDGSERGALEALAGELGIAPRVRFTGRADRATVPALFAGAAFVVVPSRADEGLPVVCAETMAAGRAVVATRVGGVPEAVLDGETGILVEPGDVAAMAGAIERLAGDAGLRARLGEAGRRRAAEFGWDRIASEYLRIYGLVSPQKASAGAAPGGDLALAER